MVVNLIQEFSQINIKKQEPLSKYTFTHTGGKADWLAFPENVEQVQLLVKFVKKNDMPLTVIGWRNCWFCINCYWYEPD